MNDYRNYQRNRHPKHFKRWHHSNIYKPFNEKPKHLSKTKFIQQEKEKYMTTCTNKHLMPETYLSIKTSGQAIKTKAVTKSAHVSAVNKNENCNMHSNSHKDKQLTSVVSKIYKFYSQNNFLQRLDFDIWRHIIISMHLYPHEIFGTILLLNKHFNKLFDKQWLIKILANKDALIIYYQGLIKHCEYLLPLGRIEYNCDSCFKHAKSMIKIITDLFEMDKKPTLTSKLMNSSISKILSNSNETNHIEKYILQHNNSKFIIIDPAFIIPPPLWGDDSYLQDNINMNDDLMYLPETGKPVCYDSNCNCNNFMQSIGMKCGYEYSSLCNCDNYHDWLHYHCNVPYRSCIIESISSKLIDMEWEKISQAPQTQLAGIMVCIDIIPTVYYLKCHDCHTRGNGAPRYRSMAWSLDWFGCCATGSRCKDKLNSDNNVENNMDWFLYDDEIEYNKMIEKNMRYKHLFDTMFLFTLLYYPPMVKHLLMVKTSMWTNDICIFSDSLWQKFNYYQDYMNMFQGKSYKNCHLRNTGATVNLQIDFTCTIYNTSKSDIVLTKKKKKNKKTNGNHDIRIGLRVCDKWN